METTKNKLTKSEEEFFNGLSEYINEKIYFYGSIQRDDYIIGKSDIDIDIFSDNEKSTLNKIQHYLQIDKSKIKKTIWNLKYSKNIVYGLKIKYDHNNVKAEIALYNSKYKKNILDYHNNHVNMNLFWITLLNILKFFYYKMHFIPEPVYANTKRFIYDKATGYEGDKFIIL